MERLTSQKKLIIDCLSEIKTHPSAKTVYLKVKEKLPQISQGTVYRILNNFKEQGLVQEIFARISRYDADTSFHAHFVCEKCNSVIDLNNICKECPAIRKKKTKVGKINRYQIYFYGVCRKCEK